MVSKILAHTVLAKAFIPKDEVDFVSRYIHS